MIKRAFQLVLPDGELVLKEKLPSANDYRYMVTSTTEST